MKSSSPLSLKPNERILKYIQEHFLTGETAVTRLPIAGGSTTRTEENRLFNEAL
ncbi:MAG: hypothetical protein ACK5NG_01905 [Chthoniobacterales bacterium]